MLPDEKIEWDHVGSSNITKIDVRPKIGMDIAFVKS
jgi:hypothetical protein